MPEQRYPYDHRQAPEQRYPYDHRQAPELSRSSKLRNSSCHLPQLFLAGGLLESYGRQVGLQNTEVRMLRVRSAFEAYLRAYYRERLQSEREKALLQMFDS